MPRFYIDPPAGSMVSLTGEDARHVGRSLRMAPGEALTLCDGEGNDYQGVIRQLGPESVTVEILDKTPSLSEPSVFVRLYQALPKSDKMELILQKSVELGACEIVPILTERCISRPDGASMGKKQARWQRIAAEAAKQCGRGKIPLVRPVMGFAQAAAELGQMERGLFLYEKGGQPIGTPALTGIREIGLMVGAEGGFSQAEADAAVQCGAVLTSLGRRILRCETAPLAALAVVMYETGNL